MATQEFSYPSPQIQPSETVFAKLAQYPPVRMGTRNEVAGSAYTAEELIFIWKTILNPELLHRNLVHSLLARFAQNERRLQRGTAAEFSLRKLIGQHETVSQNFQIVPLVDQPIGSITIGIKGRDTTRLQNSFTQNQKAHGMTGSSHHPSLDAKIGTWLDVEVNQTSFASLKTLYDAVPHAFFGEHPLFQPRSWVMDPELEEIWLAADTAVHKFSSNGEHSIITNSHFEAPHDVSITRRDAVFVCSSMDSIAFVDKRTQKLRDILHLGDFGYAHSIGTKMLAGKERRLLYYYSDQRVPIAHHEEFVVEEDRNQPVGVPTALQRLHPNAVLCIDDKSMLVSLFNTVELDGSGQIDLEKSGGKVAHIKTEKIPGMTLDQYMSLYQPVGYSITWSKHPYFQESTETHVKHAAYMQSCVNPSQRVVIKEIVKDGQLYLQIHTLEEIVTGLKNPHGLVSVGSIDGQELYGVSDTNTGTFKIFSFDKDKVKAEIVYELAFDDDCAIPKIAGRTGHWIHHPRLMKHNGEIFLSVYDGKRSGIWVMNLTQKVSSFVPMPEDAVVYQTQIYPKVE